MLQRLYKRRGQLLCLPSHDHDLTCICGQNEQTEPGAWRMELAARCLDRINADDNFPVDHHGMFLTYQ